MAPPATKEAAKAAGPAKKVLVRGAADLQVRPKKLYKAKDDKPALSKKAQAQLNAQKAGEAVSREKLAAFSKAAGLSAVGKEVSLEALSRKELQGLAIKAGIKANAKSAEIIKNLKLMQSAVAAGAAIMSNPSAALGTFNGARKGSPEEREIDDLKALGILGKTPGGTKWRTKARSHAYNLRSTASTIAEEQHEEVEGEEGDEQTTAEISFRV